MGEGKERTQTLRTYHTSSCTLSDDGNTVHKKRGMDPRLD